MDEFDPVYLDHDIHQQIVEIHETRASEEGQTRQQVFEEVARVLFYLAGGQKCTINVSYDTVSAHTERPADISSSSIDALCAGLLNEGGNRQYLSNNDTTGTKDNTSNHSTPYVLHSPRPSSLSAGMIDKVHSFHNLHLLIFLDFGQ